MKTLTAIAAAVVISGSFLCHDASAEDLETAATRAKLTAQLAKLKKRHKADVLRHKAAKAALAARIAATLAQYPGRVSWGAKAAGMSWFVPCGMSEAGLRMGYKVKGPRASTVFMRIRANDQTPTIDAQTLVRVRARAVAFTRRLMLRVQGQLNALG